MLPLVRPSLMGRLLLLPRLLMATIKCTKYTPTQKRKSTLTGVASVYQPKYLAIMIWARVIPMQFKIAKAVIQILEPISTHQEINSNSLLETLRLLKTLDSIQPGAMLVTTNGKQLLVMAIYQPITFLISRSITECQIS